MKWPKISVWSQFRNSAGQQIELYRKQISNLDYPPELLRLYLCEGDSEDDTLAQLRAWAVDDDRIRIVKHDTGIPHFAHSPRRERMKAVSENGNKGWGTIAGDAWGDYALMLESDLLYQPTLLKQLIERRPETADIFAPMIWIEVQNNLRFYDIWAYRINGKMFEPNSPEWYFARYGSGLLEVDSVGSVALFKMNLITEGLRLGDADCVLGMCNEARKRGYRIFCDPTINILHPEIEGVT
jgi:glycosyltransferase involved in cell wall biosynthesis